MTNQNSELMIKIENNARMARAIERAKQHHPKVSIVDAWGRAYKVLSHSVHVVKFEVVNGHKLACCLDDQGHPCKGLSSKSVCYHVAAAAQANIITQATLRGAK